MIKLAFPAALALVASACASPPAEAPPSQSADLCGASSLQSLVGKPRSEIPAMPPGRAVRVACTSCAVTMDYSEQRLNIFFDEATGIIREVKCG